MSFFSAKVNGVSLAQKAIENLEVATSKEVVEALSICAFRIQRTAKRSIQNSPPDPETGRSKPGNPPKTDTGRLVNSIFVDVETTREGAEATVGTNVAYGRHLEFGTKEIEPRPWLQPALEANKAANRKTIADAVKEASKR